MKSLLFLSLASILGCSPNNPPQNNQQYYFDCTVDGKHIRSVISNFPPDPQLGIVFNSVVETEISTLASVTRCENPGTFCFTHTMKLLGQQIGSYSPYTFVIEIKEGATSYTYLSHTVPPQRGNVNVIISRIERGNGIKYGVLKGSISGSVVRLINNMGPEVSMPIIGSFELPLQ